MIRILFIGDIVGRTGRKAVQKELPRILSGRKPDVVVANCENLAHGFGITRDTVGEMTAAGVRCFTSGNHIFDKKEARTLLEELPYVLRPMNYPPEVPGNGFITVRLPENRSVTVVSMLGRAFMPPVDCPFRTMDRFLKANETDIVLVDFHGEATAEKAAFAHEFDGKLTAVIGTHTHVQTADERILPGGTAFLTDAGMTGAVNSVIGVEMDAAIRRMRTGINEHLTPAKGRYWFCGCEVTMEDNGRASIERIMIKSEEGK